MRQILICVGCLLLLASSLPAAQLRVENSGGGTTSIITPGTTSVSLSLVAVTESGDNLPGVGWFGGSGVDISYSVSGSATITGFVSTNVSIGSAFDDAVSRGIDDTPRTVRNLVFAIDDNPPPGTSVGDRVTIATITFQVTGAQSGDTITVSAADSAIPTEALANNAPSPVSVSISARLSHTITVQGVGNTPPTANPTTVSVGVNQQVLINLTGSDPDGPNALSFSVVSGFGPNLGTLGFLQFVSSTSRQVLYTAGGVSGVDSFRLRVFDGLATGDATITVNVTSGGNTPPTANPTTASVGVNQQVLINLTGSDPDGPNALSFSVVSGFGPNLGTLGFLQFVSTTSRQVLYTAGGVSGVDSFRFRVFDGLATGDATITVIVTAGGTNTAPSAHSQNLFTPQNTQKAITLTGSDADGDSLSFFISSGAIFGSLSGTPPNITYTPPTGFNGVDSFTFKATDGMASSVLPGTITITVGSGGDGGGPGNQAPTANGQSVSTAANQPITIILTGSDPEGSALAFSTFSSPTRGSLGPIIPISSNNATVTYTPFTGLSGLDTFQFTVNDGQLDSTPAAVFIDVGVGSGNIPPTVNPAWAWESMT